MSNPFRDLLKKIGSGPHTGENLTRAEAAEATRLMLRQEATPAQIGAFLIAHRIKRPTGTELAGMLDAYEDLGPRLQPITIAQPVVVMGSPYDGRSRTASLSPLTALVLNAAGCAVIQHGGDCMPTKAGVPLVQTWRDLGVDWTGLSLEQVQTILATTGLGFVYLPNHFPLAYNLVPYRDQIGKRPPLATVELIWSPYAGAAHVVAGFVHPPTELLFQEAFAQRGVSLFTTVKGLEGSCDLPRERTAIIGLGQPNGSLERLHLHPNQLGYGGGNISLADSTVEQMQAVLAGKAGEWQKSLLWNSGFYLWRCGCSADMQAGIHQAATLLKEGIVANRWQGLRQAIADIGQVALQQA